MTAGAANEGFRVHVFAGLPELSPGAESRSESGSYIIF